MKHLLYLILIIPFLSNAQDSSKVNISFNAEGYYATNFSNDQYRPSFVYSHTKLNEIGINLAMIRCKYINKNTRGNVSLATGNYMISNYAAEPALFQFLYEANVGVLIRKHTWFDVGVFESHIGIESAITSLNPTLTRSLMADNSPYFESGAKVTYDKDKWLLSTLILNGWQNIRDNNRNKAFGLQVQYRPSERLILNYSNFIGDGTNNPDSLIKTRFFNNFYGIYKLTKKTTCYLVFDIGIEEGNVWHSGNLILQQGITKKSKVAFRQEYYKDPNQVIIKIPGFNLISSSLNFDYTIGNSMFRIEGRFYYPAGNMESLNNNFLLSTSLSIKID